MANNNEDQQPKKPYGINSFADMGKSLYLSDELSDVTFLFPNKAEASETQIKNEIKTVPAHKFILASISEVFATMFSGTWMEKEELEITDATADAFSEFLQCFYLDRVTFTIVNIKQVMYLADKYQNTDGMNGCVQFLMDTLAPNSIGLAYELAKKHNQQRLRRHCDIEISVNAHMVFESGGFLSYDREMLAEILKLDILCKESTILDKCMEWAKMSCEKNGLNGSNIENLRNQLGKCLYLIRFNTMTMEEFIELNTMYDGLLKPDDFQDIMHCFLRKDYHSEKFNQKTRIRWYESKRWKCELDAYPFQGHLRSCEIIQFTSNKRTILGGAYFFALWDSEKNSVDDVSANINIFEIPCKMTSSNHKKNIFTGNIQFPRGQESWVKLPQPLLILNGLTYEIFIEFDRPGLKAKYCKATSNYDSPNGLIIKFNGFIVKVISALDFMDF